MTIEVFWEGRGGVQEEQEEDEGENDEERGRGGFEAEWLASDRMSDHHPTKSSSSTKNIGFSSVVLRLAITLSGSNSRTAGAVTHNTLHFITATLMYLYYFHLGHFPVLDNNTEYI